MGSSFVGSHLPRNQWSEKSGQVKNVIKHRLGLVNLATELGNVSKGAAVFAVTERLLDAAEPYHRSASSGIAELPVRSAWAIATARSVYRRLVCGCAGSVRAHGTGASSFPVTKRCCSPRAQARERLASSQRGAGVVPRHAAVFGRDSERCACSAAAHIRRCRHRRAAWRRIVVPTWELRDDANRARLERRRSRAVRLASVPRSRRC